MDCIRTSEKEVKTYLCTYMTEWSYSSTFFRNEGSRIFSYPQRCKLITKYCLFDICQHDYEWGQIVCIHTVYTYLFTYQHCLSLEQNTVDIATCSKRLEWCVTKSLNWHLLLLLFIENMTKLMQTMSTISSQPIGSQSNAQHI